MALVEYVGCAVPGKRGPKLVMRSTLRRSPTALWLDDWARSVGCIPGTLAAAVDYNRAEARRRLIAQINAGGHIRMK